MSSIGLPRWSLRLEQAEYSRLFRAMVISLAIHLLVAGTWYSGRKLEWWQRWQWPAWMHATPMLTELLKHKDQAARAQQRPAEPPLMFVEVSPSQAVTEPPPKSQYYSDKSSLAANPDPVADTATPKIDGKQTDIVKTEDVTVVKAVPLQPSPPMVEVAKEEVEETREKPAPPPGDLAMRDTDSTPKPDEGQAKRARPRTIKEALAQHPESALAGRKVKQDGGVQRRRLQSSLDVAASPFGAYDAAIVAAVQNRWYDLLAERQFAGDAAGKVCVKFNLNSDGSISEMKPISSTVDYSLALICQSAIRDPAPYGPWPSEMRRLIGSDHREVTFTFFYY